MSDTNEGRLEKVQGQVKWFDPKKGFGFIIGPEGQDIFVHYTKIVGDGFRVLKDGTEVVYDAELTDKGWHALKVERVDMDVVVRPQRGYSRSPRR